MIIDIYDEKKEIKEALPMNVSRSSLDKIARVYQQMEPNKTVQKEENKKNSHYTDKVNLSDDAKYISKVLKLARNSEGVRHDKIEKIKSKIKEGTYNIDGKLVAQKIIEDSLLNKLQ